MSIKLLTSSVEWGRARVEGNRGKREKGRDFSPQGTKNHSDAYKVVIDFYGEGRKQYHLTAVIMLLMSG